MLRGGATEWAGCPLSHFARDAHIGHRQELYRFAEPGPERLRSAGMTAAIGGEAKLFIDILK